MGEYLNYDGLGHFKDRNDERYLKEVEAYKIPWLVDETGKIRDDDLILMGKVFDKGMYSISVSNFLKSIDTSESTITFDSGDALESDEWEDVDVIESGESNSTLFNKISTMVKNVRYLFKRSNNADEEIDNINKTLDNISETIDELDILDRTYPIGSIYMSINSTSPATLFGGTWNRIEDAFLLGAGSHSAGETGGAETVTLTSSQIPSHTHSIPALSGTAASAGSHTHTGPSHTHSLPDHTHSIPSHTHSLPDHTHSIPALSGTAASAGSHSHDLYIREDVEATSNYSSQRIGTYSSHSTTNTTGVLSDGAHTHNVTTNSSTTGSYSGTSGSYSGTSGSTSGTSGSSGTGSTGSSGSHTHDVTTTASTSGSTGSGSSHNNMPPYLSVYMWQRVA